MDFINAIIALIPSFAAQYPIVMTIVTILGSLVVVGQTIVAVTPSKSDDEAVAKIFLIPVLGPVLKAVAAFAPFQKK